MISALTNNKAFQAHEMLFFVFANVMSLSPQGVSPVCPLGSHGLMGGVFLGLEEATDTQPHDRFPNEDLPAQVGHD